MPSDDPEAPSEPAEAGCVRLTPAHLALMAAHCIASAPEEGCGLLVGTLDGVVTAVHGARNAAASAERYTIDPRDYLRIDREAEEAGWSIIGVFHSHTHTDAFPSPTDVTQAPDPSWHYVLVSLRHELPSIRSYRIEDGKISEEAVVVADSYNPT
jgi:[CysO sulfur-carrier protein]-S-L-cysteine hydrolase